MYINILNEMKSNLEKDKFKAEKCKGILKSLAISTSDVDKFLEKVQEEINKLNCKVSIFNNSEKRVDIVTIRIYANDSWGNLEGSDLDALAEVMRKFAVVPYVHYIYSNHSPYRKLCFVSDKVLSKYEADVIEAYMRYKNYYRHKLASCEFTWDGSSLTLIELVESTI